MERLSWLRQNGKEERLKKVHIPIIGQRGAGKTSLIVSLGQIISERKWGNIANESSRYYNEILPFVMHGKSIPGTVRGREEPISLSLSYVEDKTERIPADLIITTGDISGEDFEDACRLIPKLPLKSLKNPKKIERTPGMGPVGLLLKVLRNSDGLIVVVDITSYLRDTNLNDALLKSFADQLYPLATATECVLSLGRHLERLPVIYLFNKSDVHNCTVEIIEKIFRRAWAIQLRSLEVRNIDVQLFICTSIGRAQRDNADSRLDSSGIDKVLINLVRALRRDTIRISVRNIEATEVIQPSASNGEAPSPSLSQTSKVPFVTDKVEETNRSQPIVKFKVQTRDSVGTDYPAKKWLSILDETDQIIDLASVGMKKENYQQQGYLNLLIAIYDSKKDDSDIGGRILNDSWTRLMLVFLRALKSKGRIEYDPSGSTDPTAKYVLEKLLVQEDSSDEMRSDGSHVKSRSSLLSILLARELH